jgi:hypothetical protein
MCAMTLHIGSGIEGGVRPHGKIKDIGSSVASRLSNDIPVRLSSFKQVGDMLA